MILEMISILIVHLTKRTEGSFFACSAAVVGFCVSLLCLLLLLIAEMKRCCPEHNNNVFARFLGPSEPEKEDYYDPSNEEVLCCPKFGSRRFGGLGNIEPFTCLIALSPLRFIVASYVVKLFGREYNDMGAHKESHAHQHGIDPTEKVRELWLTAIGLHGGIAKTCGLFSSEILQCMLGIYSHNSDDHKEVEESVTGPLGSDGKIESSEENESSHHRHASENSHHSMASETSSRPGFDRPPTVKRYESDDFGITFDDFKYPKARLIRRMRRCERRIQPLLDEWMLVDIVLTNHELVIFDVVDRTSSLDDTVSPKLNNGGKGMYLSDIAKGRKISSTFSIDDVDFVDIEHRAAIPREDIDNEVDDIEAKRKHNLLESWQGGNCSFEDYEADAMDKRWSHVDEDRLKVHFKYNTLYLRFLVDLKEMEDKRDDLLEDPDLMHHVGTQTKVWCRTVARLRGASNLKRQNLPNFGAKGSDEIEDFIEVCDRGDHEGHKKRTHRRSSVVNRNHRRMSSWVMG